MERTIGKQLKKTSKVAQSKITKENAEDTLLISFNNLLKELERTPCNDTLWGSPCLRIPIKNGVVYAFPDRPFHVGVDHEKYGCFRAIVEQNIISGIDIFAALDVDGRQNEYTINQWIKKTKGPRRAQVLAAVKGINNVLQTETKRILKEKAAQQKQQGERA